MRRSPLFIADKKEVGTRMMRGTLWEVVLFFVLRSSFYVVASNPLSFFVWSSSSLSLIVLLNFLHLWSWCHTKFASWLKEVTAESDSIPLVLNEEMNGWESTTAVAAKVEGKVCFWSRLNIKFVRSSCTHLSSLIRLALHWISLLFVKMSFSIESLSFQNDFGEMAST
jgi:hypothetical protein